MNTEITFRHMKHSDPLEEYAREKLLPPIDKFVTRPTSLHIAFYQEASKTGVHLDLKAPNGFSVALDERGEDYYAAVDGLADRLGKQLRRSKEKLKTHHHGFGHHNLAALSKLQKEN